MDITSLVEIETAKRDVVNHADEIRGLADPTKGRGVPKKERWLEALLGVPRSLV
eukprot:GAFH01002008.1.p9 GENE.GAFH01002008.1~~GAFH01002008.1.p9  ORF type:complete len:54 (+),score=2.73 GAFH01002008.1:717-878(+)